MLALVMGCQSKQQGPSPTQQRLAEWYARKSAQDMIETCKQWDAANRAMFQSQLEEHLATGAVAAGLAQPEPQAPEIVEPTVTAPSNINGLSKEEIAVINDPIFFDTDSAEVIYEQKSKVSRKAAILLGHPDIKMQLLGSASEIGQSQYNLELAYKRAIEVQTLLVVVNQVPNNQVSIFTVGEMRANIGNLPRDRAVRTYIR